MTSETSHRHSILLILALALLASVLSLAACGTLEVRIEPTTAPAHDTTPTVEASAAENAPPTPAPRTPTPVPDDTIGPTPEPAFTPVLVDAYDVPDGLRIAFAKDGGIWLWTSEARAVALLTTVGDDLRQVKLADDGRVVAFRRADELWAIDSDGTNERKLLGADDFEAMEWDGIEARLNRFEWVPRTHTLAFNTRLRPEAGDVPADDLCLVDADSVDAEHPSEQTTLLPPGEGGEFAYSPDGSQIAVVTPGDVSLLDADGTNRRDGVLTYAPIRMVSGSDYYVEPVWAADGSALMVAVPPSDPGARPLPPTTIWRIPTDGSPAQLVTTIAALPEETVYFSSLLTYVAYAEVLQLGDTPAEVQVQLKVARLGTDDWQAYLEASALYGWAPGSRRFAFVAGRDRPQLQIGQWSGGTIPGSVDAGVPVYRLRWVDRDHYLFLARHGWEQGAEGDRFDLILGEIGGSSTVLVSAADDIPYHSVHTPVAPAESLCPDGSSPSIGPPPGADVSSWQTYGDHERGFQFRYPDGWRLEVFDHGVGVGPEEMGEDVQWGVWFLDSSDTTIERVIGDIGRQFGSDRAEVRECIALDGKAVIKVVVTTSQIEGWHSESIVFEHQGTIFEIDNGAVQDERFEAFCASFRLER